MTKVAISKEGVETGGFAHQSSVYYTYFGPSGILGSCRKWNIA